MMRNKQVGISYKNSGRCVAAIVLRTSLLALSCAQAYWAPIAAAGGVVAAATMFGDKAYWTDVDKRAEKIMAEKGPQEAISFIEAELAKCPQWSELQQNSSVVAYMPWYDLYFQLAKAKEASGFDKNEVISSYEQAIVSPRHGVEALAWRQ